MTNDDVCTDYVYVGLNVCVAGCLCPPRYPISSNYTSEGSSSWPLFFFFFFCYRWEVGLQRRCGESKWRMYDELDRSSRGVVVWLKEVRYLLAALQARGFGGDSRRGALPTIRIMKKR